MSVPESDVGIFSSLVEINCETKCVIQNGLPQLFDNKILARGRANSELGASCSQYISWRDQGGAHNWFCGASFEFDPLSFLTFEVV